MLEFHSKLNEWTPLSQLEPARVDFWLRYEKGAGKWVDKLSISLMLSPFPAQVPEASKCCGYPLLSDLPFWLSFSGFNQICQVPVPACSSKDWKNDHRVDGRDSDSLISDRILVASPQRFTGVHLHHTVSLKTISLRKQWRKPAAVLFVVHEPSAFPHLWILSRALQPPQLFLSVPVPLTEEVCCSGRGGWCKQGSLNIFCLNEINPGER